MSKIKVNIAYPLNDYENFVCDICGRSDGSWMFLHKGKKSVCLRHLNSKVNSNLIGASMRDKLQISSIQAIIKEISNV